MHHSGGSLISV